MSGYLHGLECTKCDAYYQGDTTRALCDCGSPLLVRYELEAIRKAVTPKDIACRLPSMWRYRELLPVRDDKAIVTMREGFTPLIPAERLAGELGIGEVYIKDEGTNPTGTFKARGASAAISRWKELGVTKFCQPTVGSGGHAWAAYGARAGVEIHTALPVDCPEIGWKGCSISGAHVYRVDGTVTDVFRIMKDGAERYGWLYAGALREPYRVEGKKTMGIEVAEQLGWELPDVIFYPTGGGVGIIGMWKVFDELEALGWISGRRPRMVSVQCTGGSVVKAFNNGKEECEACPDVPTIAPGIMVAKPFSDFLILRALYASKGWAVAVSDDEILHFMAWVGRHEGIFLSPEGAATVAGAHRMVQQGQLDRSHKVVFFNTATGLRYPHLIQGQPPIIPGSGNIDPA
ncbi:MAG: threonine synthase [Deltaproteobacteria bacterium]|nr:threonine synthase [Deltaproteobacteria bacterium]